MVNFYPDIQALRAHLTEFTRPYTTVYILCDENTEAHCLPLISGAPGQPYIISIRSGEQHKTLDTCATIWSQLTAHQADRHTLLVNLGGGVICDMGGFAAACYKRGIDFIHVPTTLLAMVDASVGGKTGIDFDGYKNQIGIFREAAAVLICPAFLQTLDTRQLRSGMAEVVKHYLIADGEAFYALVNNNIIPAPDLALIEKAVKIKSQFVAADPHEHHIRKALNFGHTIGHAAESWFLRTDHPLLHGEAVAIGMAVESIISAEMGKISAELASVILDFLRHFFDLAPLSAADIAGIIAFTTQDKKNTAGFLRFVLLTGIGSCEVDVPVETAMIDRACNWYNNGIA